MVKEYRIAKGWAIFIYAVAPILILGFSVFLIILFLPQTRAYPLFYYLIMIPISIGMIALAVIGLLDTIKGRFVIDADKVYAVGTFYKRELSVGEIKGFRTDNNYILIESSTKSKRQIKLNNYLANVGEIKDWLTERFPNLDESDVAQDVTTIISDSELGRTDDDRKRKLGQVRIITRTLNIIGSLIGAWTLFVGEPYEYCILTCIAIPVLAVAVLKSFAGYIHVDDKSNSGYPTIFWAVLICPAAIALRAMMDFNLFSYTNVWVITGLFALTMIAALLLGNREFQYSKINDLSSVLAICIFLYGYSFGTVVTLNCLYDRSTPELYHANVISKRSDAGKSTTYYLELTPWGPRTEVKEVSVTRELYERLHNDDQVSIYLQKGLFEIPWFEVSR